MSSKSIEVTDRLTGWAAPFKHSGLSHAYRVCVGSEEVTGATTSETAAWRQAMRVHKHLVALSRGQLLMQYGRAPKVVAE